jgi:predicted NUDIX family phosphoesterase
MSEEHILVIPRALFDELGAFHGLCEETARYVGALLDPANNFFLPRAPAEEDPGHKQIIPYCIFHHRGKILQYVRGKKGGEARLHAQASIGIGGHVNQEDAGEEHLGEKTYLQGVAREIAEEVAFDGDFTHRVVGLINDDTNPVGQVHLGIVHWVDLLADEPNLRPNEAPILDAAFRTPAELLAMADRLETWSAHCLPALERWLEGKGR